ncbi:MAG: hypothetical protein NZ455_07075 [Bacteroidia bacterium]|nr:hypothetical protein [Bacteroidia bacterium]
MFFFGVSLPTRAQRDVGEETPRKNIILNITYLKKAKSATNKN